MIDRICEICGKTFQVKQSIIKTGRGRFCSLKCKYDWSRNQTSPLKNRKSGIYKNCIICGKEFYVYPSRINRHKYCSRKCKAKDVPKGKNSPTWKGGEIKIKNYIYLKDFKHPFRNTGDYVAKHRLIMEKKLGRYLTKEEDVHHLNGIKNDNRIENLIIVKHNHHFNYIKCPYCLENFLIK